MLPESMAPPLANYDEFKTFMQERGVRVMREYIPPGEDPETGEPNGDFWTVVISKECPLPDGRIAVQMIDIGERAVEGRVWHPAWEAEIELLTAGLADVVHRQTAPGARRDA